MFGKYNFDEKNGEKVLEFFTPAITVFISSLELVKKDLLNSNLNIDKIDEIISISTELEFLDEFLKVYDLFLEFNKDFNLFSQNSKFNNLLENLFNVYPNFFQAEVMCYAINYWVTKSYDNVEKGKEVLDFLSIKNEVLSDVLKFIGDFKGLCIKSNFIDKQIIKMADTIKELESLNDIQEGIELLITIFEYTYGNKKENSNFLTTEFITCYQLLNKINILVSFIIFWEEFQNEELDLLGE